MYHHRWGTIVIYSIYKITNKVNSKVYIGFTQNLQRRWWAHRSFNGSKTKALYLSMQKYGRDNFCLDVLYQSKDQIHTLKVMEPFFIKEYKAHGCGGYNMNGGGDNPNTEASRALSSDRMKKFNPMSVLRTNAGSFKKGHIPVINQERNDKISQSKKGELNPNYKKVGNAQRLNTAVMCNVCGKTTNKGNFVRWHKH